ncbi:cytochrome c maturation protein CcmE [Zhaonella formicivorans]|uniref:cytochrome c maturation protein CcmE n=1 Tax=Zhaonella formicivorans TaxID=2528593 RepID=UPI0010D2D3EA|nr:cytochrome c maturation protein CcmE [Zhaonella formicivorans]
MQKKHKISIGVLVIAVAIGFLIVTGFGGNSGYQVTLADLINKGAELEGKYILAEGKLVPESKQWDGGKIELKFEVTDGQVKVPVVYNDVAPDNFDYPEAELILKGKWNAAEGVFYADKVETRCPSKYEAAEE